MKKLAYLADLACILIFVTIGRRAHEHGLTFKGIVSTVWPFLVGLILGCAVLKFTHRDIAERKSGFLEAIESKVPQPKRTSAHRSSWETSPAPVRPHSIQAPRPSVAPGTSGPRLKGQRTRRKATPICERSFFSHAQFSNQLPVFTVSSPKLFAQCFWIFDL